MEIPIVKQTYGTNSKLTMSKGLKFLSNIIEKFKTQRLVKNDDGIFVEAEPYKFADDECVMLVIFISLNLNYDWHFMTNYGTILSVKNLSDISIMEYEISYVGNYLVSAEFFDAYIPFTGMRVKFVPNDIYDVYEIINGGRSENLLEHLISSYKIWLFDHKFEQIVAKLIQMEKMFAVDL